MVMKITDIRTLPVSDKTHHVDARKPYESPHVVAVVITLMPGESLKRHITPFDVFFSFLEGTGVVEIGGERATAGPDTVIESPSRIPHCRINESNAIFRVLGMKVIRPSEETRLP